jgi:hypothetical protein
MSEQIPSVGRIVHYVSYGTPGGEYTSQCRAAIITEVVPLEGDDAAQAEIEQWNESERRRVGLAVLNPTGMFFDQNVPQAEPIHRGGTWHWPERVE